MECFVKEAIINDMMENDLLSMKQYGFVQRRSTTTQLLKYLDMCIETVVKKSTNVFVDPIYLDFAKVFDTVPHRRLIGKLKSYVTTGNNLIYIYLNI